MRLFIAINFSRKVKDLIFDEITRIKEAGFQGNFTQKENLHLTVVFIGDTNEVSLVQSVMDQIKVSPFKLVMEGLGVFRREGGDIYWVGVNEEVVLQELYSQIASGLRKKGFQIESRAYKPHLTLGRKMVPPAGGEVGKTKRPANIPRFSQWVDGVSLMESKRVNGKLVYSELYRKLF